jgi:hypothetical protein
MSEENKLSNEDKAAQNKNYNQKLLNFMKVDDQDCWFDCIVSKVLISSTTKIAVVGVEGLKEITYDGNAALRVGDKIRVKLDLANFVKMKPEFDEHNKVWKKPSSEVFQVTREISEKEATRHIKVLDEDKTILCEYIS